MSGMLRIVACASFALMIAGENSFAQDRSTALQSPMVRRTTLVVEDLNKSVDFFQRLGLTKWYDASSKAADPGGVIGADDLPLTADPQRGQIIIMRGNDDRIGMIGLLAYEQPPLASARSNLVGIGTSDIIIMIQVPDIQGVYSRLQQIGTRFHRVPYRYTVNRPDGTTDTGMRMFAYDPDGHLIEIAQPDVQ